MNGVDPRRTYHRGARVGRALRVGQLLGWGARLAGPHDGAMPAERHDSAVPTVRVAHPDDHKSDRSPESVVRFFKQFADTELPAARGQTDPFQPGVGKHRTDHSGEASVEGHWGPDLSGMRSALAAAGRFAAEHPELSGSALAKANLESGVFLDVAEGQRAWFADLKRSVVHLAPLFNIRATERAACSIEGALARIGVEVR